MNISVTQTKNSQDHKLNTNWKFYSVFSLIIILLLNNLTYAQTNNCPTGEPLQWDWIQNLLDQSAGCGVGEIRQFESNGNTYFETTPGRTENGSPCQADLGYYYYNCQGDYVCQTGFAALGLPEGEQCDPQLLSDKNNFTPVWTFVAECPNSFYQQDWLSTLIRNSAGCAVGKITRIKYRGNNYFMTNPGVTENGIPCPAGNTQFYDCKGILLCEFGGSLSPAYLTFCDPDFFSGNIQLTNVWWTYEDNTGQQICQDEAPLQMTWIQDLLDENIGCAVGEMRQFEYNGDTFFYTLPGTTENGYSCKGDYANKYFNCEGQLICAEACDNELLSAAATYTTIRRYVDLCPNADLQEAWIQTLIDHSDGCTIGEIIKMEYKGTIHYMTKPRLTENGLPCVSDYTYQFFNCEGQLLCEIAPSQIDFYSQNCYNNMLFLEQYANLTTVWASEAALLTAGCTNAMACNYNASANVDDGTCFYVGCNENTNNAVFENYPWLSTLVNQATCNNETITVYNAGSYNFVLIQNGNEGKLYYQNGTYYCDETPTYSCVMAYGLNNIAQTWTCGNNPTSPPTPTISGCTDAQAINYNSSATVDDGSCQYENINASVFATYPWLNTYVNQNNCTAEKITVYDAGSYNFILIQNENEGKLYYQNGTYYCDETPTYSCVNAYNLNNITETWTCGNNTILVSGCTDSNATNYNAQATVDDGSCEYETPTSDCTKYTGTFFYADCGGINYYFIRLADGRIFDPYFAEGIGITPREGQQIRFDYEIKTDVSTPCTI